MELPYNISARISGRLEKFHIYPEDLYGIFERISSFSVNFVKENSISGVWYGKIFACGAFLDRFPLYYIPWNLSKSPRSGEKFLEAKVPYISESKKNTLLRSVQYYACPMFPRAFWSIISFRKCEFALPAASLWTQWQDKSYPSTITWEQIMFHWLHHNDFVTGNGEQSTMRIPWEIWRK